MQVSLTLQNNLFYSSVGRRKYSARPKAGQILWPLLSLQSPQLSQCVCHACASACVYIALSIMVLLCFFLSLLYSLFSDRTSYPLPFVISLVLVLAAVSNQLSDTTACFFTTLSSSCWPVPSEEPQHFKSLHIPALSLWMSFPSQSGWPDPFKVLSTRSGHFSPSVTALQFANWTLCLLTGQEVSKIILLVVMILCGKQDRITYF